MDLYHLAVLLPKAIFRGFIYLIPRKRNLIVYGGAMDLFIDNDKHLFIYNNLYHKQYKHVWLTQNDDTYNRVRNLGFTVAKSFSFKGIYYALRAKFIIFDDSMNMFSNENLGIGSIRIQLWHGIPLKFVGMQVVEDQPPYQEGNWFYEKILHPHRHGTHAVSTSSCLDIISSSSFQVPLKNIIHSTYSRTRILFLPKNLLLDYVQKYETAELSALFHEIDSCRLHRVIYMPTFRDANPNYLEEAIPNWDDLNAFCEAHGIMFYLKVHRVTPTPKISYSNIKVIDSHIDIYPILSLFDKLLTDYSSIMYDYSLISKPVVLYTYDFAEYVSRSRKIYTRFYKLRQSVTNVIKYEDMLEHILPECTNIKPFPLKDYYEWPQEYDSVIQYIDRLK